MIKLIALQLLWLGCLAIYLSAKQQALINQKVAKNLAIAIFCACSVIATILLYQLHPFMHAICFVLGIIMFTWITLALWSPHCRNVKIISIGLASSMIFLSLLGAF